MPIQKFRDLDDARRALWVTPRHPDLLSRITRLWRFAAHLAPYQMPRGVRKFRSLEEANQERDLWVARRVQLMRATRHGILPKSLSS